MIYVIGIYIGKSFNIGITKLFNAIQSFFSFFYNCIWKDASIFVKININFCLNTDLLYIKNIFAHAKGPHRVSLSF